MISNNPNYGIYTGLKEYEIIINTSGGVSYLKNDYFKVTYNDNILTIIAKQPLKIGFSPKTFSQDYTPNTINIQFNPLIIHETNPSFNVTGDACDLSLFRYLNAHFGLAISLNAGYAYNIYIVIDEV